MQVDMQLWQISLKNKEDFCLALYTHWACFAYIANDTDNISNSGQCMAQIDAKIYVWKIGALSPS